MLTLNIIGVSMAKSRILCVFVFVLCPAFAQSDFLWAESQKPRTLLMDLYASLYQQKTPISYYHAQSFRSVEAAQLTRHQRLLDTLIYLNNHYNQSQPLEMLEASQLQGIVTDRLPNYADTDVFAHITKIYRHNNRTNEIFEIEPEDPDLYSAFLTVADKVDGAYDSVLALPNLKQFYTMLVDQKVPLPAICYNCREDENWVDRRTLVRVNKLTRELPKNLLKLKARRFADDEQRKLAAINRFVNKRIISSDDGYDTDYWQTPEETLLVEEGDCEDYAILFHAIAKELGVTTKVVVGDITMLKEGEMKTLGHAWVEYKGKVIDPILTSYEGPITYMGHFRFDEKSASLVLPPTKPNFDNRLAGQ